MDDQTQQELATTRQAHTAAAPPASAGNLRTVLVNVEALACQLQRCVGSSVLNDHRQELTQLVALLDHREMLVAYAAKEALRGILGPTSAITDAGSVVRCVLSVLPSTWKNAASGFRFQLLRHFIKEEDASMNQDSECDDEVQSRSHPPPYLSALAANLLLVGTRVRGTFIVTKTDTTTAARPVEATVCYEAVTLLNDVVKRLHATRDGSITLEVPQLLELSGSVTGLLDEVLLVLDYASQPTFVTCAVLELLGELLGLVSRFRDDDVDAQDDVVHRCYHAWLQRCLAWMNESSCTTEALRLLHTYEPTDASCQASFVSEQSRFPFLQQWLVLLGRLGVALVEGDTGSSLTGSAEQDEAVRRQELSASDHDSNESETWLLDHLPRRHQLFAVLSEQDDIMVEVLCALTRMAAMLSDGGFQRHGLLAAQFACPVGLITHVAQEFDPDLLFMDLMGIFSWDHLVLLDLLVSSETRMLEYLLLYLRRLGARWRDSKRKLVLARKLDDVLSVLIRLRMEIERLEDANLFPYGAGPLVRRLLIVEQLYEGEESSSSSTVDSSTIHPR